MSSKEIDKKNMVRRIIVCIVFLTAIGLGIFFVLNNKGGSNKISENETKDFELYKTIVDYIANENKDKMQNDEFVILLTEMFKGIDSQEPISENLRNNIHEYLKKYAKNVYEDDSSLVTGDENTSTKLNGSMMSIDVERDNNIFVRVNVTYQKYDDESTFWRDRIFLKYDDSKWNIVNK